MCRHIQSHMAIQGNAGHGGDRRTTSGTGFSDRLLTKWNTARCGQFSAVEQSLRADVALWQGQADENPAQVGSATIGFDTEARLSPGVVYVGVGYFAAVINDETATNSSVFPIAFLVVRDNGRPSGAEEYLQVRPVRGHQIIGVGLVEQRAR